MIITGDVRETLNQLPDGMFNCCVTSPPYYGLRDYGHGDQIGLEETPEEYILTMVEVFRQVRRVLRDDGTLWLNLGDSYAGSGKGRMSDGSSQATGKQATSKGTTEGSLLKSNGGKPKDLLGIPWRVALALQSDGWYLRQDIIWHKPNPMPESVTDRCTKAHEYIFLLSKSRDYYFDHESIKEPATSTDNVKRNRNTSKMNNTPGRVRMGGLTKNDYTTRNRRSVWTVTPKPFKGAHFATFSPDLIEPCILAGCPVGGFVLDPFLGSGTTAMVAQRTGRHWMGCELNPEYVDMAYARIAGGK